MSDYYGNDVDCDDDILTDMDAQLLVVLKRAEDLNLTASLDNEGFAVTLRKENGDVYAEYPTILNAYSNTVRGNLE